MAANGNVAPGHSWRESALPPPGMSHPSPASVPLWMCLPPGVTLPLLPLRPLLAPHQYNALPSTSTGPLSQHNREGSSSCHSRPCTDGQHQHLGFGEPRDSFQGIIPTTLSSRNIRVLRFLQPHTSSLLPAVAMPTPLCHLHFCSLLTSPTAAALGSLPSLRWVKQPPTFQLKSQLSPLLRAPSLTSLEVAP